MEIASEHKKYKSGYCMVATTVQDLESFGWLQQCVAQCEEFTLGIPDEWTIARLYGDRVEYHAEQMQEYWRQSGWFTDVIILDAEHLMYQKAYEKVSFDVCYYGTEYGIPFEADKQFMAERNISFISMMPETFQTVEGGGSLRLAIEDLQRRQKVVLFGTGAYFDIYMREYVGKGGKYLPAYALDNNSSKWNGEKSGISIKNPDTLLQENPEDVLVILCSKKHEEMVQQIKQMGNFNYRILRIRNEISLLEEFAITAAEEREYLKRSHEVLEILMAEFDRVCMENHLHYYIICGSLIGVVRHKGMIPWDDDIDIGMPREDYKKLKKIAKKIWKNNDTFHFLNYADIGGGAFLDCMPRLFYMKEKLPTKCFDKVYGKATADIEDRMFLDIYVMDNAHENERVHNLVIGAMKGIYNLMMGHRAFVDYDEYRVVIPEKTIKFMKFLHGIGRIFPIHFLAFWYDAFARSANWNKKCKDYIMESCAIRCIELKYPKEHLGEGLRLPFENIEVMVPSDYDGQLHDMRYRNYMEFPRLSVRKPSHYFNSDIEIW